jgi:UDP-N-acetylmuramate--alanine ligase
VGRREGAVIYDDYAHHPTEVRATLEALRELRPGRIVAVFQPHLYSRTKALAADFGAALAEADEIGVLEVYPAREEPVGPLAGVSGLTVARAAADRAGGKPVLWLRDRETAAAALPPRLREGDLLVTIGAGDINLRAAELAA